MLFIPSVSISIICFLLFLVGSICVCVMMLLMGFLLGGRSISSYSRNLPFESGVNSIGSARLRFSIKFYLIGIFFVIFDTEALYFYIWSIVIRQAGWLGLVEIVFFAIVLLLGLIYLISMDVFNWKKNTLVGQ